MSYKDYLFDCEKFRKDASNDFFMDALSERMAENIRKAIDQEIIKEISEKFRAAK